MLENFLENTLVNYLHGNALNKIISVLISLSIIIVCAVFAYYVVKFIAEKYIRKILYNSESEFLHEIAVRNGIAIGGHLASALTFRIGSDFISQYNGFNGLYINYLSIAVNKLSMLYLFIACIVIITSIIKGINPYYDQRFNFAKRYPIKPYINVVIFIVWVLSAIFIAAFFTNSSLTKVFASIGAASAIFILIFRDTLLGIMSSIQAAASNIVRIGDRISIEKYNLDGTIVSIAINSVRIRNSDNTVATIPTYMLTTEVVKNWRAIEEYGERRIKRVILLDINSIKAYDNNELAKFMAIEPLTNYIVKNQTLNQISNVELFRVYIEGYLKNNPHISHNSTIMVHQLELGPNGLLLEIYAYTTKVIWEDYQRLSSNIIEHCLITLPSFDLKAFQINS